jgi:hypothetical protein
MTAALYDEVTVAAAPKLHVVRDGSAIQPAAPKTARRVENRPYSDPLVDGAARLLTVPVRHVYAALLRIGVLDVQA